MDKSDKNDAENQIQYLIFPKSALVTLIFTVQVVAAAWACFTDWKFPFSAAKQTAELIEGSELRSMPVVGDADMIVSTVSGYLQKPVYYLLTEKNGDYITWNKERDKSLHEKELINRATKYSSLQKQDILLILTYELKENHPQIQFIKSFTQSIEPSEIYYLYTLKYE